MSAKASLDVHARRSNVPGRTRADTTEWRARRRYADPLPAVLCFAPDGRLQNRIAAALQTRARFSFASSWRELERYSPAADASLVAAEWLRDETGYSRLGDLKCRLPLHPMVLVTTRDADNVALLGSVSLEEIVWLRELERNLPAAVERACDRGPMMRLARELEQADHLAHPLRRALAGIFASHSLNPSFSR